MKYLLVLLLIAPFLADAMIMRQSPPRTAFIKTHPCPTTGLSKRPCKGYVIDHVKALACGGPDVPSNMQWQTVEDALLKDRWERIGCCGGVQH